MNARFSLTLGLLLVSLCGCELLIGHEETEQANSTLPQIAAQEAERCYGRNETRQAGHLAPLALERDVMVLVDLTTQFPDDVRQSVVDGVAALAAPGSRVTVGTFSSYTESDHAMIAYEAVIEPNFPQDLRSDAPMRALSKLDECLDQRRQDEAGRLRSVLDQTLASSDPTIERSDILANIKDFSRRLSDSQARDRILVIVSDLLENSSALSFYRNGAMRVIEPEAEMARVERADLFSRLPETKVYVIGAGLIPPDIRSYRSLEELTALKQFWNAYFTRSEAKSVEIGTPRLHNPIA